MIGVAVGPVGAEGDHDLGPQAAQVGGDPVGRLPGVGLVEVAVNVAEQRQLADTQGRHRAAQLSLTEARHRGQAGVVGRVALPAALAEGGCHQIRLDPLGGVLCQGSATTKGFIVGVGQDSHQAQGVGHGVLRVSVGEPSIMDAILRELDFEPAAISGYGQVIPSSGLCAFVSFALAQDSIHPTGTAAERSAHVKAYPWPQACVGHEAKVYSRLPPIDHHDRYAHA